MLAMIKHLSTDTLSSWAFLTESVRDGAFAFQSANPGYTDLWDMHSDHPDRANTFAQAMTAVHNLVQPAVTQDFDWGAKCERIVDIGGGYGESLAALLEANQHTQGVVFDLPGVIRNAKPIWVDSEHFSASVRSRTELVEGDFFHPETIPQGKEGDCMYMRLILHDMDDTKTLQILVNLRTRVSKGTRLVLAEFMPNAPVEHIAGKLFFLFVHTRVYPSIGMYECMYVCVLSFFVYTHSQRATKWTSIR
jgi:C-methyltransferase